MNNNMFTQIAFFPIMGLPMIVWGGIFTLLLFILAAVIGYLNSKGVNKPPIITYKGHKIIALIALISGIGHGLLGLLSLL